MGMCEGRGGAGGVGGIKGQRMKSSILGGAGCSRRGSVVKGTEKQMM